MWKETFISHQIKNYIVWWKKKREKRINNKLRKITENCCKTALSKSC